MPGKIVRIALVANLSIALLLGGKFAAGAVFPARELENLDRGVVAIPLEGSNVYISWRLLGTEPPNLAFNLYRRSGTQPAVKLNREPLRGGTNFTDYAVNLALDNAYWVRKVENGREEPGGAKFNLAAHTPANPYLTIPLQPVTGTPGEYFVQHGWPGDLDGDGKYDYVVTRVPVDYATKPKTIDAYRSDGRFLWRIDLGKYSYTQIDANDAPPGIGQRILSGGMA